MFSHLHCHTMWSALDGFGAPDRWVKRLQELGMKAIAVTEHGNIDSSIKMSSACKEAGIKYIAGCEFYICKNMAEKNTQMENRHICVFAQNKTGWQNMLKMLSKANVSGYHYKPRIDGRCLLEHLDGIIISTACLASFVNSSWGYDLFEKLTKRIPERLFLEIMPHDLKDQREWNKKVVEYAEEFSLPVIATNDCHYPLEEDAKLQEVCLAINSGSTWKDPKRFRFEVESFFLKSEEEMKDDFEKFHPELDRRTVKRALRNTQKIVDMCEDFKLEKINPDLPLAPNIDWRKLKTDGMTEDDYFRKLIMNGLREKRKLLCRPLSEYKARIEEELELLIEKKFTRYFLIVIDILDFCRKNGIAVGPGRGSVGGCLVAWLTGITQVDPLKYDLLFSRFQDPSRCFLPNQKVLSGGKKIKIMDLFVGDEVINAKGKVDHIIAKHIFDVAEEIYELRFETDRIFCTADHQWIVQDGKRNRYPRRTDKIDWEKESLVILHPEEVKARKRWEPVKLGKVVKRFYRGPVVGIKVEKDQSFLLGSGIVSKNCDLPDIDLDFEQDRRGEVVEYIRQSYGMENVAQITTFLTMKGKQALQDVGRVFEVPRNEIGAVTKLFDDSDDITLATFTESQFPEVREFYSKYKKIVNIALAIKDTIRGYGKHAAGVCISNHNLTEGINGNLAKRQGILVSNWDKDEGEYMGLMKLDILGLTALSRIRVCCEMIEKNTGNKINLQEIDVEDSKALATINRGDCVGIFQLGTYGLTKYCQELGIESFKDVYNATALFRPGTLGSGMAMEFVKRKHGGNYRPIHSKVVPFTKDTEGIILYQEQCMFLFKELAGFDWGKCNKVRKVIAKSKGEEALEVFKQDFLKGCQEISKMSESGAVKVWETVVDFSKYAFNKCLAPDSIVKTIEGEYLSLKEVPIGTLIETPEGFCPVEEKHYNGKKDVFSLKFDNGAEIKCTADHKFLCSDNKKHPVWEIIEKDLKVIYRTERTHKTVLCKISDIEFIGEIETMDLGIRNKSHTFFANGLATSNSHSVEYSVISMWDAWLKTYYPGEFYASCLSYLAEDKRIEIIEEAAGRGIGVILPKYGLSEALLWSFDREQNTLVMPFQEIEGVGEKTAIDIEKSCRAVRKTFFGNKKNLSGISSGVKMALAKIHADDPKWKPSYKDVSEIKNLFKYNLKKILFE